MAKTNIEINDPLVEKLLGVLQSETNEAAYLAVTRLATILGLYYRSSAAPDNEAVPIKVNFGW